MVTQQNKTIQREYFIDFLKTLAIIFIIIDNAAICWNNKCHLPPENVKLLYGECFWNGQGVPLFLFISGWLFVKWADRNKVTTLKGCYTLKILLKKYIRYVIPIGLAFIAKIITLGCVDGWGMNVLNLYSGTGSYYISIVLQLVIICPLIYFLIKKLNIFGLIICFAISSLYDIICWLTHLPVLIYKQFIIRFIFIIAAGIYVCLNIKNNKKYQWYFAIPSFSIGLTMLIMVYYFNLPMHVNHTWFQDCTLANLYAIPIISLLVRTFKMPNQKWWSYIGSATFNIFLCQNILYTFPKKIVVANHFVLQVLFNEAVSIASGWCFWFGEHYLTRYCCKQIDSIKSI